MANLLFDALFAPFSGKTNSFLHLGEEKTLSYSDFLGMVGRYANLFVQMGLSPNDRVAVQIGKSPEALAIYGACIQAGMVFLPLNTAYTANEVAYFIENSGASLFVCDPSAQSDLKPIASRFNCRLETLNENGNGVLADLAAQMPDSFSTVNRAGDDIAAFLYTSGTTGRSKGAMLTHNNLLSNAQTLAKYWRFTDQDVLLHALPIFHTHGLFVATNITLVVGSSMIFLPKFSVDAFVENIPHSTVMMGVPTFYTRLLGDERFDKKLTQDMRLFISGSAPLLAETHIQFETQTGHRILERYGMTETNMNISNPYDGERRAGTVGFPLPGVEIKITDSQTGAILPQGEIGEIEVRGPNVFKGYWQMPEKTAEELRSDGFFITGDLGQVDKDGYVQIVGRNKDLIISGGFNIYPKEIEQLIDNEAGVLESAVIGVPHPDFGETVVGIIVANADEEPNLDVIQSNISESLARFKLPKKLIIVSELPRNTMGKVQKKLLRAEFGELFESVVEPS